jgi:Tfp pilus assembly protein PilZ
MIPSQEANMYSKYNIVISQLFNLILNLNEAQQNALLRKAEELFLKEKRAYPRKSCRIPVRYSTFDRIYSNCITNISQNGVFIETEKPLFVREEILMDFTLKGFNEPLKLKGEVAHATRTGIGVKFKNVSTDLAEMLGLVIERMIR